MQARRIEQLLSQSAARSGRSRSARSVRVSLQVPIAALLKFAILPDGVMTRLERLNSVNRGPRRRNVTKLQKRSNTMRRNTGRDNSGSEKRFYKLLIAKADLRFSAHVESLKAAKKGK